MQIFDAGRRRGPARATLVTASGTMVGAIGAFFAAILAARALPADAFAAFGVGLAINSLCVQLADLGVGQAAVAETATDWRVGAHSRMYRKLLRLAGHRLLGAVVVAVVAVLLAMAIPGLEPYRTAIAIGAAGAILWSLSFLAVSALQAAQRFGDASVVLATIGVLRFCLVGAAAIAGTGYEVVLAGYAAVAPLAGLLAALVLLALRGRWRASEEGEDEHASRSDFRGSVAIAGVSAALLLNIGVPLLVLLSSPAEVAIYVAAWRVAAGVLVANTSVAQALLPYIVLATDPWRTALRLQRAGVLLTLAWLVLVPALTVVGLAMLGPAGEGAGAPLAVLAVAFSLHAFIFVVYQVYLVVRRAYVIAVTSAAQVIFMVSVTVAVSDQGALAPAIGQLAASVLGCLIVGTPILLARVGRIDWFSSYAAAETSQRSARAAQRVGVG